MNIKMTDRSWVNKGTTGVAIPSKMEDPCILVLQSSLWCPVKMGMGQNDLTPKNDDPSQYAWSNVWVQWKPNFVPYPN